MKRSARFNSTVLLASAAVFCLPVAALAGADDAPAGIKPAHVPLTSVLQSYRSATAKTSASGTEVWSISMGAMTGTRTLRWSHSAYRIDQTLGPYHTAEGRTAAGRWHQNENGQVVTESGLHQRDMRSALALARADGHGTDVTLLGQVDEPVHAFVIKVAPDGGRVEYLFLDRATFQLVRSEEVREGRRYTTMYSDFRPAAGGKPIAWHIREEDGKDTNVREESLTKIDALTPAPETVAMATPVPSLADFKGHESVDLRAKIVDDRVIVMTTIAGRPVDFQLDSGASAIVLNRDVVKALKIEEHGHLTGTTAGDYIESDATIPSIDLGAMTLNNVHVKALPFIEFADEKTPVAGLMGFDFIASSVIHIDYANGKVEAYDPQHFVPPADAQSIPIALDDDVPLVQAAVSSVAQAHFMLDTGADHSLLFSTFTAAHPNVTDAGLGDALRAASPFVDEFSGVGGEVSYRPLQLDDFRFGAWRFDRWLFYVTQDAPMFETEDYDGLLGQDLLRNYDVYIDYTHQRLYFRPNARYTERFG